MLNHARLLVGSGVCLLVTSAGGGLQLVPQASTSRRLAILAMKKTNISKCLDSDETAMMGSPGSEQISTSCALRGEVLLA